MKQGARVKLTKLEGEVAPSSESDRVNPNIGYTLDGYLFTDIDVGYSIKVIREHRNGVKATGIFTSSPVKAINDNDITTSNSIWRLEYLMPPDYDTAPEGGGGE